MTSTKSPHYRYIIATDDTFSDTDPICKYKLFGKNKLSRHRMAIRLSMPDDIDLQIVKNKNTCYAITTDRRMLSDFNYDCIVRINHVWITVNQLRHYAMSQWFDILLAIGFYEQNGILKKPRGWHSHNKNTN